jgi:hypothetical protein
MSLIGVAGDEYGHVVAVFEGERQHVDGQHDVDAFLDLSAGG